ncbi:MAG: NRDE family protein [Xanthomonadales bacterium]|nr:NRDE family protein [Xanthomonadales bacterium]
MCLILLAIDTIPEVPLLLLGNRDEFHDRPTRAAAPWDEDARVVGGRDLVAGGTWLAARSDGRFAAATNLRTGVPATAPRSRGWLVRDFVLADEPVDRYLATVQTEEASYGPFNLVAGDARGFGVLGSSDGAPRALARGVHLVSNGRLDTTWPKTRRLAATFAGLLAGPPDEAALLALLQDESMPPDSELPDTGVGRELERLLAPVFIHGERYGTRASSLLMVHADGRVVLRERRYGPHASVLGEESRWEAADGGPFRQAPA